MGYSGTLVSASKAENIATGTVILNSAVSGFAGANYSLSGGQSKFVINSSTGQVTLANPLDYETATSHTFTVTAEAGGETKSESFSLNVSDINVGFSGSLASASKAENIATGTVILNSTVSNFSNPSYSLSGGNDKFSINSSTGQVTLANALDYETAESHTFTVTAAAGGETESQNFTLNIDNFTYTVTDSGSPSKRIMSVDGDVSNDSSITYHFTETGSGEWDDFVIANLGQGLPAGTTYSSSNNTYSGLAVSSDGRVTAPFPNVFEVNSTTGAVSGQKQATISINIPNEPTVQRTITLAPKNVEPDKNLVMKFAGGYNNVQHDFTGANPFTAVAHRDAVSYTHLTLPTTVIV